MFCWDALFSRRRSRQGRYTQRLAVSRHTGHGHTASSGNHRIGLNPRHLLHSTSALRYPVFVDGQNYSGSPAMLSRSSLRQQIETHLAEEIQALGPKCLYVPLGSKVTEVFQHLQAKGLLKAEQLLDVLPHPSGANSERISYFLGGKPREKLSRKTNPTVLDGAKARILAKLATLQSERFFD